MGTLSTRKMVQMQLFTKIEQTVGVEENGGMIWLTRSDYCTWKKNWEGKEKEEIGADWDSFVADALTS